MSVLRCNCTIHIEFSDPQILYATEQALVPEEQTIPTNRVMSHIERIDNIIRLQFSADDLVGLRAAVNSYLRWISSIQDVLTTIPRITAKTFT